MKDVKGYEGLYAVTSCGRVWSYKSEKFLKPGNNGFGYSYVILYKDSKVKIKLVHRLVAEAYIPNTENYDQVNHKDENKENNCLQNLEWCDAKYNVNYGTCQKRKSEARMRKVMCVETGIIYNSLSEAAKNTNILIESISNCCNGKTKTAGKYHWRKVD